jgi:hypothetical protein
VGYAGMVKEGLALEALPWEAKALDGLELPVKVHPWKVEFAATGRICRNCVCYICVKRRVKRWINIGKYRKYRSYFIPLCQRNHERASAEHRKSVNKTTKY